MVWIGLIENEQIMYDGYDGELSPKEHALEFAQWLKDNCQLVNDNISEFYLRGVCRDLG